MTQFFAMYCAFAVTPGAPELVKDAVHWVVEGHTVHQDGHADENEHGCSTLFHTCRCCAHLYVTLLQRHVAAGMPVAIERVAFFRIADGYRPGYGEEPFRPPTLA